VVIERDCVDAGARKSQLAARSGRVLYWGPPFDLDRHRNAVSVFCISPQGQMRVWQDGATPQEKQPCRTVFIPAGTLHQMDVEGPRIACLYLDPLGADAELVRSTMTKSADGILTSLVNERALLDALEERRHDSTVEVEQTLLEQLGLPSLVASDRRIEHAVFRLLDEPLSTLTLAVLAKEAGLSRDRFRHAFKDATGVPFRRFRIWARMRVAMSVAHSGGSLTEAAHAAGFATSAHFSRCFRAMFGLTPSRFMARREGQLGPHDDNLLDRRVRGRAG
jgi:AraC-like DNA-binding protein